MKLPHGVDLAAVGDLARRAGDRIMAVYGQETIERMLKADMSPVTAADISAHAEIALGLRTMTPGLPLVSEEDLPKDPAEIVRSAPFCWLVDPLDGTRDFLSRTGDFTVNIALMAQGQAVLGCVYAPVRKELYLAARGRGATRTLENGPPAILRTRAMEPETFSALVSTWHRTDERERIQRTFPKATVKRMGSSLKYVVIAASEADIAVRFTPTSLWDTAAAQCVLEEAGGALVTESGAALTYTHGDLENPPFVALGDRQVDVPKWLKKLGY